MLIFKKVHKICVWRLLLLNSISWIHIFSLNALIKAPYCLCVFSALLSHPAGDGCVCTPLSFALAPIGRSGRVKHIPAKTVRNRASTLAAASISDIRLTESKE